MNLQRSSNNGRDKETAAKAALLKAVQREENNPEYLCELGSVCVALGDVDEAIQYLKRAEPTAASFPQIYYVLGQAYLKKGERDKGAAYLKKVQELNVAARQKQIEEQQELTFITKGEELLDKGGVAEAKSLFEQARLANPRIGMRTNTWLRLRSIRVIPKMPTGMSRCSKKSIPIPSKQTF